MLNHIRDAFWSEFSDRAEDAIAYSLNREFMPTLRREVAWANEQSGGGALSRARAEIEEVKGVMVANIEKVLQRGEHLDLLVDKAEELEYEANRFKKNATKLRKKMWWENMKWKVLLFFILGIIITFIALGASGKLGKKK